MCLNVFICDNWFHLWLFPYDKFLQVELLCQQARIFLKLRIYTATSFQKVCTNICPYRKSDDVCKLYFLRFFPSFLNGNCFLDLGVRLGNV